MSSLNLIPFFILGLLGSGHCIGMCGGIVSALSMSPGKSALMHHRLDKPLVRTISYNLGRITSYTVAGGLLGGLVGGVRILAEINTWQSIAYLLTNFMLIGLGLYLMDVWHSLTKLEALGQRLWQCIKPISSLLLPLDTPFKLLLAGSLWGWLPCSMVYSVLITAMLSGTATTGAGVMFAFGLGTLPTLLIIGVAGAKLRNILQHRAVRLMSGALVITFGILGLARAWNGAPSHWFGLFCA